MGREENPDRREAGAPKTCSEMKAYTKPRLQRLGSVGELTQMTTKYTK